MSATLPPPRTDAGPEVAAPGDGDDKRRKLAETVKQSIELDQPQKERAPYPAPLCRRESWVRLKEDLKVSPKHTAEKLLGTHLKPAGALTKEQFFGTWHINPSSGYAVKSFTVNPEDVFTDQEVDTHVTKEVKVPPGHCLGGKVLLYVLLRKKNVVFNRGCFPGLIKRVTGDIIYILTCSEEGIVRFHVLPTTSSFTKLMLILGDSRNCCAWFKNFRHGMKNGCFCLGLMYEIIGNPNENKRTGDLGEIENKQEKTERRKFTLVRFNRWAGDLADLVIYWAAVNDESFWAQQEGGNYPVVKEEAAKGSS